MKPLIPIIAAALVIAAIASAVVGDTTFPPRDPNRDQRFAAVEFFGYVYAETNPGGNQRRLLTLVRSEISKHDPVAELAFGANDEATYAECVKMLDKKVRVTGVVVDRGGVSWVLVESVRVLK